LWSRLASKKSSYGRRQRPMKKINPQFIKLKPHERLYQLNIPLLGITGGIASGKSLVSKKLLEMGHPVLDADQLVKKVYQTQEAKDFVANCFSGCLIDGKIDFHNLRQQVFASDLNRDKVETFVYQRLPAIFTQELATKYPDISYLFYDAAL